MTDTTTVRLAEARDRDAFLDMWRAFVESDPDEPGDRDMGGVNWERITGPGPSLSCLLAVDAEDRPLGFLLYLSFPFTWSRSDVCYLQDIFVRPEARGRGCASALIRKLAEIGAREGWYKIFWMTQQHNVTAQSLYDRVGIRRDYIRYDLML